MINYARYVLSSGRNDIALSFTVRCAFVACGQGTGGLLDSNDPGQPKTKRVPSSSSRKMLVKIVHFLVTTSYRAEATQQSSATRKRGKSERPTKSQITMPSHFSAAVCCAASRMKKALLSPPQKRKLDARPRCRLFTVGARRGQTLETPFAEVEKVCARTTRTAG